MISRFAGTCNGCGKTYPKGAEIYWSRIDGTHHEECWKKKASRSPADQVAIADRLGFRPMDSGGAVRPLHGTDSGKEPGPRSEARGRESVRQDGQDGLFDEGEGRQ